MAEPRLSLLSLDGGGVRGLCTLAILKQLMLNINPDNPPLPCNYFDMIGGTSTGGLLAIMLGRLRMSVDACMDAYVRMSDRIFSKKRHRLKLNGQVQGRFDSEELERCVKEILVQMGMDPDALLRDDTEAKCKVFVCVTSEQTGDTVHLTSYRSPRGREHLFKSTKIWEACRATSAASSFFDPVTIGDFGESFVDGATGANNPVGEVWNQAKDVWSLGHMEDHVQCLVSVGTGIPSLKPFGRSLADISKALLAISTETEKTAERFVRENSGLEEDGRYYRFNVLRGLEDIGLEDSSQRHAIVAATGRYLESQAVYKLLKACSATVRSSRLKADDQDAQKRTAPEVHKVVQDGDLQQLSKILQDVSLVNSEDPQGLTPLHIACEKSNMAAVRLLLNLTGIDIEKEDDQGRRALHCAAAVGSVPICMVLLKKGSIGEAQDHRGWTPAHYAANAGHTKVLQLLRDQGDLLQSLDHNGDTPIHAATLSDQVEAVYFLIESKVDIRMKNFVGLTALQLAEKNGYAEISELILFQPKLLSHGDREKASLYWAAEGGHYRVLDLILDVVDDVDCKRSDGFTSLLLAAKNGHTRACKMLLDRRANIEIGDKRNGLTPLHLASKHGHSDVVSLLLDNNANMEALSRDHLPALLYAARHGNTEVVKVLLDRGCNAKVQNQAGNNALVFACISKSVPCVSLLLELEPETNRGASAAKGAIVASAEGDVQLFEYLLEVAGDTPGIQDQYRVMMRYALHRGEDNMVKLLLQKGLNINAVDEYGKTMLDLAIKTGWTVLEQIKILVKCGGITSDPRAWEVAFHIAVMRKDIELLQMLLDTGHVNVNVPRENGRTALFGASKEITLLLLQHGVDVNHSSDGETALHLAARNHEDEVVKILLEHGADIDCEDRTGDTPLTHAFRDTIKILLDAGADPNAGSGGQKAIHKAAYNADEQVVRWLLDAKVNAGERDKYGNTAFEIAIKQGRIGLIPLFESHGCKVSSLSGGILNHIICRRPLGSPWPQLFDLLLDKGVDVNAKTRSEKTALMTASECGYNEVVESLLKAGADPNQQDQDGFTAIHSATMHGARGDTVIKTLLKAGARITVEDCNGYSAIEWAVCLPPSKCNEGLLDAILEKGPDLTRKARGLPLLYSAIVTGNNPYTVRRLIECGVDLSMTYGRPPTNALNWAETLRGGSIQKTIKNLLTQYGVEPLQRSQK